MEGTYRPLPHKFDSQIMGRPTCDVDPNLEETLKAALNRRKGTYTSPPKKAHIVFPSQLPEWVIKGARIDAPSPDSHIYRVRKERKCDEVIQRYGWQDRATVAKKCLFFRTRKWYVAAKKLKFSDILPRLNPANFSEEVINQYPDPEAIRKRLKQDDSTRPISPEQAEVYATLAFEAGLVDLIPMNLEFTEEGLVAIFDTEPLKRARKKAFFKHRFTRLFPEAKPIISLQIALVGTAKLKVSLCTPESLRAVEKVENHYVGKEMCKLALKIALSALAFFHIQRLSTAKAMIIGVRLLLGVKLLEYGTYAAYITWIYRLNRLGNKGLDRLICLEEKNTIF